MPVARVEIISHPLPSDPPKDYATNTIYFETEGTPSDASYQSLSDAVSAVWKNDGSLTGTWGNFANRNHEIKVYAMSDPAPRPIRGHTLYTASFPDTGPLYPREVALCLSFYSGRNLPRQRGRIYIGPFDVSPFQMKERPPDGELNKLISLAGKLANIASTTTPSWAHAVWSTRTSSSHVVTDYWVNDEWDTVRRRGVKETKRMKLTP